MRVGSDAAPAAGRLRTFRTRAAPELRPAANTSCPPGAWPIRGPAPPACAFANARSLAGETDGSRKARPALYGRRPRWRAMRRPRSREGTRYRTNNGCATWRAISLYFSEGQERRRRTRRRQKIRAMTRAPVSARCCLTIEYVNTHARPRPRLRRGRLQRGPGFLQDCCKTGFPLTRE